MREQIAAIINQSQGLKGTELVIKLSEHGLLKLHTALELVNIVEQLSRSGEIVELEYTLPQMDYRIKSIYFPKGTKIHQIKGESK